MKSLKLFFISLLLLTTAYSFECKDFACDNIDYHWENSRYTEALEIFYRAFDHSYKELDVPNRETILKLAQAHELELVLANPDTIKWLVALDKDKIVGLCIIELNNYPNIYIRQLAVLPEYQKRGIGKSLTFGPVSKDIKKIDIITRRINKPAIAFYSKIGFQFSDFCHEGYDPEKYVGMEWKNLEWEEE